MYIVLTLFDLLLVLSDVDFGRLTHWGINKMTHHFVNVIFQIHFLERKWQYFDLDFTKVCEDLINNKMAIIG